MEITGPTSKDKKLSRSDNTLSQFITPEVHEAHGVTLKNLFASHLMYPDMFLSRLVWIERDLYDQAQHEVALDTSPFVDMSRLSDRTRHELSDELSEAAAGHDYLMHHTKSRSFPVKDDLSVKFIYEPDEYEGYSRVTMSLSDDENKYGSTAFHMLCEISQSLLILHMLVVLRSLFPVPQENVLPSAELDRNQVNGMLLHLSQALSLWIVGNLPQFRFDILQVE